MSKQLKADLMLLFVTVAWGASYYLTDLSLKDMGSFTLNRCGCSDISKNQKCFERNSEIQCNPWNCTVICIHRSKFRCSVHDFVKHEFSVRVVSCFYTVIILYNLQEGSGKEACICYISQHCRNCAAYNEG